MRVGAILVSVVVLLLATAGSAHALPGDPPIELLGPDDGAAVLANEDGIGVRFTCPVFRQYSAGLGATDYGDYTDYGTEFARSPQLGVDGRLLESNRVALGSARESNVGAGQCTSGMYTNEIFEPNVQEIPGTYYWQVYRFCTGCATNYETSGVRRFVVRAAFDLRVNVQKRAFSGYPVIVGLRAGGVPDDATVAVQRRAGKRWKKIASGGVFEENAEAVTVLPRGRQRLRARVKVGDEVSLSSVRTVRVSPARSWSTRRADDGRYTGRAEGAKVSLRVAGGGRLIRDFTTEVTSLCIGPSVDQNRITILTAPMRRARIAPDGRFFAAARVGKATDVTLRGRLRRGRITGGRVDVSLSTCTGTAYFSARRAGG